MNMDFEIYDGKSFKSLIKDVVVNSQEKREQLKVLEDDLRKMITGPDQAVVLVPMLKDYMEVGVKNDEQLVKIASVIQKVMNRIPDENDNSFALSEEEKEQLIQGIKDIKMNIDEPISIKTIGK